MKSKEITVLDQEIHINKNDYFSLTDIARYKNPEAPADVVKNWICYTKLDAQNRYDSIYGLMGTTQQPEF